MLIASNPGGSLPLLETFSRSTAKELTHAGYDVRPLFNHAVTARSLRKAMRSVTSSRFMGFINAVMSGSRFTCFSCVDDYGFSCW